MMKRVYEKAGKRKQITVARICLSDMGWNDFHEACFENCKHALANQVKRAHRDEKKRFCGYPDASDFVWPGVVTQIPTNNVNKEHQEKRHEALVFHQADLTQRKYDGRH